MDAVDAGSLSLVALYAVITLVAPRVLSRPQLLWRRPQLAVLLWTALLLIATASLTIALGLLIGQALQHHVEHVPGHTAARATVDTLLGWLAVAVTGILAFRIGAAGAELRASAQHQKANLTRSLSDAEIFITPEAIVWIVPSAARLIGVVPSPHRVIATTAVIELLDEEAFRAAVAHEEAHIQLHHIGLRTLTRLAESTAAGFRASRDYAQVVRVGTELIADQWAAERVGSEAVIRALVTLYPKTPGVEERVLRLRQFS